MVIYPSQDLKCYKMQFVLLDYLVTGAHFYLYYHIFVLTTTWLFCKSGNLFLAEPSKRMQEKKE